MTAAAHAYDDTAAFSRAETLRRLKRLSRLARFMDTALRVPGTNIRLGADSIIGLVPGIGDAGGAIVGLVIVNEARKLGLPPQKLVKMLANIGVDALVGSVPVAGDVFDVYFKAHKRNFQIVIDHFEFDQNEMKDITPKRR